MPSPGPTPSSRHTPVAALVTDAPDAAAAGWLGGLGFRRVPGDETAMFVALGTIEALVEGRPDGGGKSEVVPRARFEFAALGRGRLLPPIVRAGARIARRG